MPLPTLKPQEVPFDHPQSCMYFRLDTGKPFVMTVPAARMHGVRTIHRCLNRLQKLAKARNGIDYLQVFTDPSKPEDLWFIEDGEGGAITALLPSDY